MTTDRNCRKCAATVPERVGPGRPALYCSTACRRLAEHEVRRLTRRLDTLSDVISSAHIGWGGHSAAAIPRYEAEVARLEGRLRELIEDRGDDGAEISTAATEQVPGDAA